MSIFKKKWFWIIFIILMVVAAIIYFNLNKPKDSNYVTAAAKISDLHQTVEVTGTVEAAKSIDLSFKTPGTLNAVMVDVGDEVKKNQILARLYSGDVSSQVQDARASLEIARSDLDKLLAGASGEDIKVTEEELQSAITTHASAIDTLENLKKTRDQEIEEGIKSAVNLLNDKYFIAGYSLDIVYDAIMDDDADDYLFVSSLSKLNQAKDGYNIAKRDYNDLRVVIDAAIASYEYDDVLDALDQLEMLLEGVADNLLDTFEVMLVTIDNTTYTTTVIDAFKASLNAQNTAVNAAISSVHTSASGLRDDTLYYQNQIIEKENAVLTAKNSMELAQARLDLKKVGPREFEIKAAEANVARAQANLNRNLSNLSEYSILSPIDGLITQVNFEVGEQTSAAKPVVSLIGTGKMQIEVDVPESDVTKVEVGDEIEITLDAFSSDEKFSGQVTFIDPSATLIEGVTYYKVTVVFNEKDSRLKDGMTADLTISTESKEGVLVVPSRAIIYRDGKKLVQILENGFLVEKEVSTGLRGDGGLTEVLNGLSEGEEVITFIKSAE